VQQRDTLLANAPFVSVVVATHNRISTLATTLDSLMAMEYPNFEIVVVDNAPSNNDTADFLAQKYASDSRVRYVREDNPGLAIAHNRGIQEVKGSIVAFTDDDVMVDRYWLAEIVRGFQSADNVGCVTGLILPGELESQAQLWVEQYGGFRKGFDTQIFDLQEYRLKSALYPYAVGPLGSGANMAFRRDVLIKMKGFDPALGAGSLGVGGDDLAAFYDVITRGYRLVYQPAAMVRHWDPREYASLRRRAYGYGVGLTAYLTKCMVEKPWLVFDIAMRLPFGLVHLLSAKSPKNNNKKADYPRELTTLERKGILYGPIAYMRSYWRTRNLRFQNASPQMTP
jgi:GT2 family glycosyltransferase